MRRSSPAWHTLSNIIRALAILIFVAWIGAAFLILLDKPGLEAVTTLADPLSDVLLRLLPAAVANEGARAAGQWRRNFNVINLPRGMVRRAAEIREVQKQLLRLGDRTPQVVIVGMGGTGKTILALHVVYACLTRLKFRNRVLWLQADQLDTRTMLGKIGDQFVPAATNRQQPAAGYASDLAAGLSGKRTLIVLDDLPEALTGDLDLGLLLKLPCAFLVTSRYTISRGIEEITLKKLTRKEWSALVFNRLATKSSIFAGWIDRWPFLWQRLASGKLGQWSAVIDDLWRVVEGHPLALSIIAGDVAAQTDLVPETYVDNLKAARLEELDRGPSAEASVRASLRVSYVRLPDSDPARFAQLGMRSGHDLPFPFICALWGEDEPATRYHLRQFAWRHLVEPIGPQRWRLHVLVGEYARECLNTRGTDKAQASGRLAKYYATYVTEHVAADMAALTEEWPDLQHAMDWAVSAQEDEAAVDLALRIRPYFDDRRWWSVKRSWLESAREPAGRLPNNGPRLDLLEALGDMYSGAGTLEQAQGCYADAVSALPADDDDPRRRARLLEALARASAGLGQYRDAGAGYDQARLLYQQVADWAQQVMATSHLFRLLMRQRRQREAAELCGRRYADAVRRTLAGKPACAHMVSDLGDLAAGEGDIDKAARQYDEALQILPAEDLAGQAWIHYRRGRLSLRAGDHRGAHRNYQQALALYRSGPDFQGFAKILEALGSAELSQYRLDTAEAYYARAQRMYGIVGDRPGQLHTSGRLAEIAALRGDLAEADAVWDSALAACDEWQVEEPLWQANATCCVARVEELRWKTGLPDPLLHADDAGSKLAEGQRRYIDASVLFAHLKQPVWQVRAMHHAADLACIRHSQSEAQEHYRRASILYGSLGRPWQQAETADRAAYLAESDGSWLEAATWYHVAEQAYASLAAGHRQAQASYQTAHALHLAREFAAASDQYSQAAEAYGAVGQTWWQSELVYHAGLVAEQAGVPVQAQRMYERAAALYEHLQQPRWQVESLYRAARIAEQRGCMAMAAAHYAAAADLYGVLGEIWRKAEADWRARRQATASILTVSPDLVDYPASSQDTPAGRDTATAIPACQLTQQMDDLRRRITACQKASTALGQLGHSLAQADARYRIARMAELLDSQGEALTWYQSAAEVYLELEPWSWAETMCQAGTCAERLGRLDEAKESYKSALSGYQRLEEPMFQACIATDLARLDERRDDLAEASKWHNLELRLYGQLKHLRRQAEATVRSARLAEQCGEPAQGFYEKAAEIYGQLDFADYQVEALLRAAHLVDQLGTLEEARDRYQQVAVLYDQLQHPWRQADASFRAATASRRLFLFSEAKEWYHRALGIFHDVADLWWEAESAYHAGHMAEFLGDLAYANEKYRSVIYLDRHEIRDPKCRARAGTGLARLATIQERYEEARNRFEASLELCKNHTFPEGRADALLGLGDLALLETQFTEASSCFESALNEARDQHLIPEQTEALVGLGRIKIAKRDFAGARSDLEASLALSKAVGSVLEQVKAHNALAEMALAQGAYVQALEHLDASLPLVTRLEVPTEKARALVLRARVALVNADWHTAMESLQSAKDLFHCLGARNRKADVLYLLGEAAICQGNYHPAERWLNEALVLYSELAKTSSCVDTLLLLAEADQAQNYPSQAADRCEEAAEIYQAVGDKWSVVNVYHRFALLQEKYGSFVLAAEYCLKALEVAGDPTASQFDAVRMSLNQIAQRMELSQAEEWKKTYDSLLARLGHSRS